MRVAKAIFAVFLFLVLISAGSSLAAQDRYIRLKSVEGEVTLYPADNTRPNEATVNTPLLDGDEIQTGNGRAELSFRNGVTVRIGDFSGVRIESSYTPMKINLLQGTVFIDSHLIDRFRDELELRAGDAQVYLIDEGNIRVDLGTEGSIRVTTIEGQAEVQANGRRVLLNAGERTYVDPGNSPEEPQQFSGQTDELDDWNSSTLENYAGNDFGGNYENYVGEDLRYDTYDLSAYGDWRYEGTYGNVWVPYADYGWRPYNDGRWMFVNGGWFWVSYEPWGWAPYHYGRWGWSFDFGWYWIPGNTFGPAWVSWYSYGDYVGWCPMNYYNNPIYDDYYNHHNNYYPSIQKPKTLGVADSWNFVKKSDLGARNIKKALLSSNQVKNIKIDKTQIVRAPRNELTSYVIPKTRQYPGFVNDKNLIKQPGDIKNPVGINHREEQFVRPESAKPVDSRKPSKAGPDARSHSVTVPKPKSKSELNKSDSRDSKPSSKPANKPSQIQKPNKQQSSKDRDWQFKRNESNKEHYSPFLNPYYRGGNREFPSRYGDKQYDSRDYNSDHPDRDDSYRYQDVNPKYRDEAKKYFERFEHRNPPESQRPDREYGPARNYTPPSKSYSPPSRNYEAPKRDYKAPEVKRPDNNSSRSRPSNNNSTKSKKPN